MPIHDEDTPEATGDERFDQLTQPLEMVEAAGIPNARAARLFTCMSRLPGGRSDQAWRVDRTSQKGESPMHNHIVLTLSSPLKRSRSTLAISALARNGTEPAQSSSQRAAAARIASGIRPGPDGLK